MAWLNRRRFYYLVLVAVTTLLLTVTYNLGMAVWENRPQPLYRSLEVVFQSFTTTGYGEDAPWQSPEMNVLVIVIQLTGIGLILTAVDVFAVPWLRDAVSASVPETLAPRTDHVVICGYTPRTDVLLSELDDRNREAVLVTPEAETAIELHEAGYALIHGNPESTSVLERAHVADATALVMDVADDTNASIALSARESVPGIQVISLVEDADLARYHRIAGVDTVLSPRQLLGQRLSNEVPTAVTTEVESGVEVVEDFELAELTVEEGSELYQRTYGEAGFDDPSYVTVVGEWVRGNFETSIDPRERLDGDTRLLVGGDPEQLESLRQATAATVSDLEPNDIIIAGYGDTGQAAYEQLAETRSRITVLDIEDKDGVDMVGDARDPDVLSEAGIETASILLLTVAEDTTAIFATLIARDINPDIDILVRSTETEDKEKLYRAGADYVQTLATVSGRMLASTLFEGKNLLAYDQQISIVRLPAPGLAGEALADHDVRSETGCTVLAVFRDDEVMTSFDPSTLQVRADNEVVVAGTDEDIASFEQHYGG